MNFHEGGSIQRMGCSASPWSLEGNGANKPGGHFQTSRTAWMEQSAWIYGGKISLVNPTAFYIEKTGSVNEVRQWVLRTLAWVLLPALPLTIASQTDVLATQIDSEVGLKTGWTAGPKQLWSVAQSPAGGMFAFNKHKTRVAGTMAQTFLIQHCKFLPVTTYSWSHRFLLREISLF